MKDEEMAEKKYCNGCKWRIEQCLWAWRNTNGLKEPNEKNCSCKEVPAFLAGLKAGRPQWHDLRKDKNDLPDEGKQYLCCVLSCVGGERVYACLIYNTQYHSWQESYGDVIKWCEIPTFDKE